MSTTETKVRHTPTPWHADRYKVLNSNRQIVLAEVVNHYQADDESRANAQFIVRAVNSHADMLEALEAIEELATRQIQGETPEQCHAQLAQLRGLIHRTAQAAIAKGGAA